MLLDWEMGVSGCGRSLMAEQSGKTNLVRFSYSANSRIILGGTLLFGLIGGDLSGVRDASYAAMFLVSRGFTSKR
jgi:hypothetical protein